MAEADAPAPTMISETGSCHCGSVEFTVEGAIAFNGLCHCKNCTRNRGVSPCHLIGVAPKSGVQVTKGEEFVTTYLPENGTVSRCFCSKCGSLVNQGPVSMDFRAVMPVAFNKEGVLPDHLLPKAHLNYESRTYNHSDSLPKFCGFPAEGKMLTNEGEPVEKV